MSTMTRPTAPVDPIGADLTRTLRALKLGGMADTLPERLHLARQQQLGHAAFLELVLSDEVTRREGRSATLQATRPFFSHGALVTSSAVRSGRSSGASPSSARLLTSSRRMRSADCRSPSAAATAARSRRGVSS